MWFFSQKQEKTLKKETKHIIRTLGTVLFILYVLALIYFLFFSEGYGRVSALLIYTAGYFGENEKRMADYTGRIWT